MLRPVRIGLTGPIGCGKSTIADWLAEAGGLVIDADQLARVVTAPGQPALGEIERRFGMAVIGSDDALDRQQLGRIVFDDDAALRDLEAIVHPPVRVELMKRVAAAAESGASFVVIEAIKLIEGGYAGECDEVWLVECRPSIQRVRLAERGLEPDEAERRMRAQGTDLVERLSPDATRRISTDGSLEETRGIVLAALASALESAAASAPPD